MAGGRRGLHDTGDRDLDRLVDLLYEESPVRPEDLPGGEEDARRLADWRRVLDLYRSLPLEQPPEELDRAVLAGAAQPQSATEDVSRSGWLEWLFGSWTMRVALAAACMGLLVFGYVLLRGSVHRGTGRVGRKGEVAVRGPSTRKTEIARMVASAEQVQKAKGPMDQLRHAEGEETGHVAQAKAPLASKVTSRGRTGSGGGFGGRPLRAVRRRRGAQKGALPHRRHRRALAAEKPRLEALLEAGREEERAPVAASPPRAKAQPAVGEGSSWGRARALLRSGRAREALRLYRRLAGRYGNNAEFLIEWAEAEARAGSRARAMALLNEAVSEKPALARAARRVRRLLHRVRTRRSAPVPAARPARPPE